MVIFKDNDGAKFELPKLTLDISDQMDDVQTAESNRERYSRQLSLLQSVLPDEYLEKKLDGTEVNDVDLTQLNCLYIGIVQAYSAPVAEAQNRMMSEQLRTIKPAVEAARSINGVIKNGAGRQGFGKVIH